MARKSDIDVMSEQISALVQGVTATSRAVELVSQQMTNERKRTNDLMSATFESLSKRERPVFVKTLRKQGYTQEEVGEAIGRSQSAVHQYEKKYDMHAQKIK
ncbi:MAG TPA: helix-turn-helix transcriptional regulator [Cellvibrionaceae bacterium]|nr:helix-turn-helix transcriptional regulator [Cellvibrionaceae bacterium]HMW71649.1 helix-turn-helix transcriptional regulator [Cellvibrionaceae bacterium]HMY37986.1 helix-turn-helix transcriptional regulator [Marinagarivorans sp.]HNG61151.1 helix-turn-helix transcriptional regulator [Cellvibrionaceae bacterium]